MTSSTPLLAGPLAHLGLLRFRGADSLSFLQGQLSNDTRRLAEGLPLLAAYSTPQGRVLAVLRLLPHSSGVLAILPHELLASTRDRLSKFVLRSKVTIEDASATLAVAGLYRPPAASAGYGEDDEVGFAPVSGDPTRQWAVGPRDKLAALGLLDADAGASERGWRLADIRAGLPQVYEATTEAFVAQMLNLDLLDGISFSKGCYTGQEIIARTQHLGRIKRRLYRLALPRGDWQIGQALQLSGGRAGRLTEVALSAETTEGLAVLNVDPANDSSDADVAVSIIEAKNLPLPYSV